jgi:hypothetical protein
MPESKDKDGLSPQKRLFCKAFILIGNLEQSVRIAYPGINKNYAAQKANRLMKDQYVLNHLKELEIKSQGTENETAEISKKILNELEIVGFSDPRSIYPKDSDIGKELATMGDAAKMIKAIEIVTETIGECTIRNTKKYHFHDKLKALELRGKNIKLYTEVMNHTGEIVNPIPYKLPDNGMREPVSG